MYVGIFKWQQQITWHQRGASNPYAVRPLMAFLKTGAPIFWAASIVCTWVQFLFRSVLLFYTVWSATGTEKETDTDTDTDTDRHKTRTTIEQEPIICFWGKMLLIFMHTLKCVHRTYF